MRVYEDPLQDYEFTDPDAAELNSIGKPLQVPDGFEIPTMEEQAPQQPQTPSMAMPTEGLEADTYDPNARRKMVLAALAEAAGKFAYKPVQSTVPDFVSKINELNKQKADRELKVRLAQAANERAATVKNTMTPYQREMLDLAKKRADKDTTKPLSPLDDPASPASMEARKQWQKNTGRPADPSWSVNQVRILSGLEPKKVDTPKPMTPQEQGKFALEVGNAYKSDPQTADTNKLLSSYGKMQSILAANDPSGAGDISLIFGFMKMMDPASTVREGEFDTAAQAEGALNKASNIIAKFKEGQLLTDEGRRALMDTAGRFARTQYKIQKRLDAQFRDMATRWGVNPRDLRLLSDVYSEQMETNEPEQRNRTGGATPFQEATTSRSKGIPASQVKVVQ